MYLLRMYSAEVVRLLNGSSDVSDVALPARVSPGGIRWSVSIKSGGSDGESGVVCPGPFGPRAPES